MPTISRLPGPSDSLRVTGLANVRGYGATGDGSHDDYPAVQAALAAIGTGPGVLYFPPGTYRMVVPGGTYAAIQIKYGNIWVQGCGQSTTLRADGLASAHTLAFSGSTATTVSVDGGGASNLTLNPIVTKTSNAYEVAVDYTADCRFHNITVGNPTTASTSATVWGAFRFGISGTTHPSQRIYLDTFNVNGYLTGLSTYNINDIIVSNGLWVTARPALNGIICNGFLQALMMTNVDLVGGNNNSGTGIALNATSQEFNKFTNVYIDSFNTGLSASAGSSNHFTECWFSDRNGDGAVVSGGDGYYFNQCHFINCGGRAVYLNGGQGHLVANCDISNNGSSTALPAIHVGATCQGARISGNRASNTGYGQGTGTSTYGLQIESGAKYVYVNGNDFHQANGVNNLSSDPTVVLGTNF